MIKSKSSSVYYIKLKCLGSLISRNICKLYKGATIYSPIIYEIHLHVIYNKCNNQIYYSIYKRPSFDNKILSYFFLEQTIQCI